MLGLSMSGSPIQAPLLLTRKVIDASLQPAAPRQLMHQAKFL